MEFDAKDYKVIRDQIQKWLADDGMFKKTIIDENSNFHFIINFLEHKMEVIQPKGMIDRIIIGCMTQVSPKHINAMEKLRNENLDEMKKFLYEFRSEISLFDVDMGISELNYILLHYVVQDEIYYDGLSKHVLMKTIKKIFRANLRALWKIQYKFGEMDNYDENKIYNKPSHDNMFV